MTIAYLNVATDRQHLDIQREEITDFATVKKLDIDKWIVEVSGEKVKQPGPKLKLVLDRLKKGDRLIVLDISRLSRTLYELMEILTVCVEKEVDVYCINDRYVFNGEINRKVMVNTFKVVDEIDHALVSIRTKDALVQIKNSGRQLGRPKGSDSKQFFLDAHKSEIMEMLEKGESVLSICKHFDVSKNTFYKFKKNFFD